MFEVDQLYKKYTKNSKPALNRISFSSDNNQPIGILGSNGAGKTTLFMIANALLSIDEGDVIVNGFSVKQRPDKIKEYTGLFTDKLVLYPKLSVKETVKYFMGIYQSPMLNYDYWINLFGLNKYENKKVKQLSTGMLKKLLLLISIIPKPKVLFLDEPFSGLDPLAKKEFIRVLKGMCEEEQVKLILSSHDLTETQMVVKEVVILEEGSIIESGKLSMLLEKYNGIKTLTVSVPKNAYNLAYFRDFKCVEIYGDMMKVSTDVESYNNYICDQKRESRIIDIVTKDISLDDLYSEVRKNAVPSTFDKRN